MLEEFKKFESAVMTILSIIHQNQLSYQGKRTLELHFFDLIYYESLTVVNHTLNPLFNEIVGEVIKPKALLTTNK